MLEWTDRVENLFDGSCRHVDCYVSTDAGELDEIIAALGYAPVTSRSVFLDERAGKGFTGWASQKACYLVETTDTTLQESDSIMKETGFPVMSFAHIYCRGNGQAKEAVALLKALRAQNQNVAFVAGDRVHALASESYAMDNPGVAAVVYRKK